MSLDDIIAATRTALEEDLKPKEDPVAAAFDAERAERLKRDALEGKAPELPQPDTASAPSLASEEAHRARLAREAAEEERAARSAAERQAREEAARQAMQNAVLPSDVGGGAVAEGLVKRLEEELRTDGQDSGNGATGGGNDFGDMVMAAADMRRVDEAGGAGTAQGKWMKATAKVKAANRKGYMGYFSRRRSQELTPEQLQHAAGLVGREVSTLPVLMRQPLFREAAERVGVELDELRARPFAFFLFEENSPIPVEEEHAKQAYADYEQGRTKKVAMILSEMEALREEKREAKLRKQEDKAKIADHFVATVQTEGKIVHKQKVARQKYEAVLLRENQLILQQRAEGQKRLADIKARHAKIEEHQREKVRQRAISAAQKAAHIASYQIRAAEIEALKSAHAQHQFAMKEERSKAALERKAKLQAAGQHRKKERQRRAQEVRQRFVAMEEAKKEMALQEWDQKFSGLDSLQVEVEKRMKARQAKRALEAKKKIERVKRQQKEKEYVMKQKMKKNQEWLKKAELLEEIRRAAVVERRRIAHQNLIDDHKFRDAHPVLRNVTPGPGEYDIDKPPKVLPGSPTKKRHGASPTPTRRASRSLMDADMDEHFRPSSTPAALHSLSYVKHAKATAAQSGDASGGGQAGLGGSVSAPALHGATGSSASPAAARTGGRASASKPAEIVSALQSTVVQANERELNPVLTHAAARRKLEAKADEDSSRSPERSLPLGQQVNKRNRLGVFAEPGTQPAPAAMDMLFSSSSPVRGRPSSRKARRARRSKSPQPEYVFKPDTPSRTPAMKPRKRKSPASAATPASTQVASASASFTPYTPAVGVRQPRKPDEGMPRRKSVREAVAKEEAALLWSIGKPIIGHRKTFMDFHVTAAKTIPGPAQYEPPKLGTSPVARWGDQNPKSDVELQMLRASQQPGPGDYQPRLINKGASFKFGRQNPKTEFDWIEYHGKQVPGPADYAGIVSQKSARTLAELHDKEIARAARRGN